ncbi:MAG: ParB/RepB/Spo0J family partition protein [Candidatus Dojkabacteria bacterium]|nr:ParB/RepB/Spo0J family partition protein [Candidatus Dojkabacteria bacterium]
MTEKNALGKGLSALISDDSVLRDDHSYIPNLPINQIKPNPHQPRMEIKPESLLELSDTIREHGIIEPLIVTQKNDDLYELIAGERRWRAAKLAGLKKVPAVIKEVSQQEMLELAVIENVQRADLNALEEGLAFKQLADNYKLTHSQIAKKVGLSRPAVANKIRLLNLPEEVKRGLLEDKISEGHARALLGLASDDSILAAYQRILKEFLSVRDIENMVRSLNEGRKIANTPKSIQKDPYIKKYEQGLIGVYGNTVSLRKSRKDWKLTMVFSDKQKLDAVYKKLV